MDPSHQQIYLDYNATSPLSLAVADRLPELASRFFANPSSPHPLGRGTRKMIEQATTDLSRFLHVAPNQIIYTSGATESIQTVISSFLSPDTPSRSIALPRTEHPAVLSAARMFEPGGAVLHWIKVGPDGLVELDHLKELLRQRPDLVSFCAANNETGVLAPVQQICTLCHDAGVPVHVDATQWVGRLPWPQMPDGNGPDFVSFSGHKFGALKGCGALIVSPRMTLNPLIPGGGQQYGARGGTLNTTGIVSMGLVAASLIENPYPADTVRNVRDTMEDQLLEKIPEAVIHARTAPRLPNTSSVAIPGRDAEEMVHQLARQGISISTGSACSTGKLSPSHVLLAMGVPTDLIRSTIRISLGPLSSSMEVDCLLKAL